MDDLTRERFGLVPTREAKTRPTPLLRTEGDGGPDTPEAIAKRCLDLDDALWPKRRRAAA